MMNTKKITISLAICLCIAGSLFAQGNWTSLFNGKNLKGWKQLDGKAKYEVKDGTLCSYLLDDTTLSGLIALQVHQVKDPKNEGLTVAWRNIRICTQNIDKELIPIKSPVYQVNSIDNTLSEQEAKEGWKLLFDGKTTQGWKGAKVGDFPSSVFVVDNGMIKIKKAEVNSGGIITEKKYKNFELLVDFKLTEGANSGIKYFVNRDEKTGNNYNIGCEYQILDDQLHPDAKLGVKGNRKLGSLYDLIAAPDDKPFRPKAFNHARIVVNGNKVEHWLNDVKIVEYERNTQMWQALVNYSKFAELPDFGNASEGNILLQDHGDEVWFKNIKIREL